VDPDPTFHIDADLNPDPSYQVKAQNLEKVSNFDVDPDPDPTFLFDTDPDSQLCQEDIHLVLVQDLLK
jgi:hypothetical protein